MSEPGPRPPSRPRILLKAPTLAEMEEMNISEVKRETPAQSSGVTSAKEIMRVSTSLLVTAGQNNNMDITEMSAGPKKKFCEKCLRGSRLCHVMTSLPVKPHSSCVRGVCLCCGLFIDIPVMVIFNSD